MTILSGDVPDMFLRRREISVNSHGQYYLAGSSTLHSDLKKSAEKIQEKMADGSIQKIVTSRGCYFKFTDRTFSMQKIQQVQQGIIALNQKIQEKLRYLDASSPQAKKLKEMLIDPLY